MLCIRYARAGATFENLMIGQSHANRVLRNAFGETKARDEIELEMLLQVNRLLCERGQTPS